MMCQPGVGSKAATLAGQCGPGSRPDGDASQNQVPANYECCGYVDLHVPPPAPFVGSSPAHPLATKRLCAMKSWPLLSLYGKAER